MFVGPPDVREWFRRITNYTMDVSRVSSTYPAFRSWGTLIQNIRTYGGRDGIRYVKMLIKQSQTDIYKGGFIISL